MAPRKKGTPVGKLIVMIPGSLLPKEVSTKNLSPETLAELERAYTDSIIFSPNLTATKSEKLLAAMSKQVEQFKSMHSSKSSIASDICAAFEIDSINCPLVSRAVRSLMKREIYEDTTIKVDADLLVDLLETDHGITTSTPELYREFTAWKYYDYIKTSVGGVSLVKFMRFVCGLAKANS